MLVLSRKRDERINLYTSDGLVQVTVCAVKGDTVKIGIDAPEAVKVLRKELEQRIAAEAPKEPTP